MDYIVIRKPDNSIALMMLVDGMHPLDAEGLPVSDDAFAQAEIDRGVYKGCPWFWISKEKLAEVYSVKDAHEQVFVDDEAFDKKEVKLDHNWTTYLMPQFILLEKVKNRLHSLCETADNHKEFFHNHTKYIQVCQGHQPTIYQCALDFLADAEIPKPSIQEKLQQKVNEFNNGET